jgi:hypothetical protein
MDIAQPTASAQMRVIIGGRAGSIPVPLMKSLVRFQMRLKSVCSIDWAGCPPNWPGNISWQIRKNESPPGEIYFLPRNQSHRRIPRLHPNRLSEHACYFSVMKPAVPIDVRVTDRVNITK